MAIEKKERSTYWLVVTYISTAGILFPVAFSLVISILFVAIFGDGDLSNPLIASLIWLVFYTAALIGVIVGVQQATAYINRRAIVPDRMKIVRFSLITMAILSIGSLLLSVLFPDPSGTILGSVWLDVAVEGFLSAVFLMFFYILSKRTFARS